MKKAILLALLLVSFSLSGCAMKHTTIQSYEIKNPNLDQKKAFTAVQNILLDKNFDIKISNPDAGLITTEYKKYDDTGNVMFSYGPPFDFYLQIKAIVRTLPDNQISVKLSPIVKEQNRLNSAAFTEEPLEYYETNDSGNPIFPNDHIHKATDLFESVVTNVAEALGSNNEAIIKHIDGLAEINTTIEKKQPKITKKIESKTDYMNSIALQNIHVGDTASGDMAVFGEMQNNGNKTLKTVELTINCLGQNGQVIYTIKYHPVWSISKSLAINTPLNSGESRRLGFRLSDVPAEWDKKVDVKVTDIEFVE